MLECDEQARLLAVPKPQMEALPILRTAESVLRVRVVDLCFVKNFPGDHS